MKSKQDLMFQISDREAVIADLKLERDAALAELAGLRQQRDEWQAQAAKAAALALDLQKAVGERDAALVAVTRQRDAAVAALRAVEWGEVKLCPSCSNYEHEGHAPGCQLATALALQVCE